MWTEIKNEELVFLLLIISMIVTYMVILYKELKTENKSFQEFEKSVFKTAKVSDNIGNTYYSIVLEDRNGVLKELEQLVKFEKYRYKSATSRIFKMFEKYSRSFTTLEEAERELKNLQLTLGQISLTKNIELTNDSD